MFFRGVYYLRILRCFAFVMSVFSCLVVFTVTVLGQQKSGETNIEGVLKNSQEKLKEGRSYQQEPGGYLPLLEGDVETPQARPGAAGVEEKIYIKRVKVKGGRVFSRADFNVCMKEVIGRAVSEDELISLSECITKIYTDAGYPLSRTVIPPQNVDGGILIVRVVEGYISSYRVEGMKGNGFNLKQMMTPVLAERPLTLKTLERQLLLINDTPGLTLQDTVLEEKGELSGEFELVLQVNTWKMFLSNEVDNRGTEAIGPLQNFSSIYFNSLFFEGDSVGFSFSSVLDTDDELKLGKLSIDLPINDTGARLFGYVSASETLPSDNRALLDTRFRSFSAGLDLNYAVRRSRDLSVFISGGLWALSSEKEDVSGRYVNDKSRGVTLSTSVNFFDPFAARSSFAASLRQGLDIGDVSERGDADLSRSDGRGVFTRFNVNYYRWQALDDHWSIGFDGALQLASEGLLSSEEFYLGGARFGRGFESAVVGGDSGFAVAVELAYKRNLNVGWLNEMQVFGFVDMGALFDDGDPFKNGLHLSSFGGGVRFFLDHGIRASFEVGVPLEDGGLSSVENAEYSFRIGRSFKLKEMSFSEYLDHSPLALFR